MEGRDVVNAFTMDAVMIIASPVDMTLDAVRLEDDISFSIFVILLFLSPINICYYYRNAVSL